MKLALGPILYYWPRDTVFSFYRAVAIAPVDIVYLGETVCARRHELDVHDWLDLAHMLEGAGKQVVLSTQPLAESESELEMLGRIVGNGEYPVEANDMGAVQLMGPDASFVAGGGLNVYNADTLACMAGLGASRWVAPVEISRTALAAMQQQRPPGVETEVFVHGRLPLAHSARCFTARRFNLQKEACGYRCLDFPEGLAVRTRELQPFLVLNGLQTQSASVYNLMREIPAMASLGVDVIRMSPPYAYMIRIAEFFKRAISNPADAGSVARELDQLTHLPTCDGYWHGAAGMEQVGVAAEAEATC